jgi:hypothetical protein
MPISKHAQITCWSSVQRSIGVLWSTRNSYNNINERILITWLNSAWLELYFDISYEFIWPFDSAKMLQISKFSTILTPSSLLDFSVNTRPRPSSEKSIFISLTCRFQCYNAKLSSINTNGAISISLSFKINLIEITLSRCNIDRSSAILVFKSRGTKVPILLHVYEKGLLRFHGVGSTTTAPLGLYLGRSKCCFEKQIKNRRSIHHF